MRHEAEPIQLRLPHAVLCLLACLPWACLERREPAIEPVCPTWEQDLGPDFSERCLSCHSGPESAAGYDLSSYLGAIGPNPLGQSNARAGDPNSTLLRALEPRTADFTHQPFIDLAPIVRKWVVDCRLAFSGSPVHAPGILDPRSTDFHGTLLRERAWNFAACAGCHGPDFEGGPAHSPCTSCHPTGPTDCPSCHDQRLLAQGAHAAHVPSVRGLPSFDACVACHPTPSNYTDPGHLFTVSGTLEPPVAKVVLGSLAQETPDPALRGGPPTYDPLTGTCSNVYCHGDVSGDERARLTRPGWYRVGQGEAACGNCHGLPPLRHPPESSCELCHQRVVGPALSILAPSLHVNGQVELGRGQPGCSNCHGSSANAAPPLDLLGHADTGLVSVGAHQAHLRGLHRLRGPIACHSCHLVPTELNSPGHIDHPYPALVFPNGAASGGLEAAGGANPRWNRQTSTCSDVYCHGGGVLANDQATSIVRQPTWTSVGQGQAACGRCHGIPPADGGHLPSLTLRDCASCHPSVDGYGNVLFIETPGGSQSLHMDGQVDVL